MGIYDWDRGEYYSTKKYYINDDGFDDLYDDEDDAMRTIESIVYNEENFIDSIVDDYTLDPDCQIPDSIRDYEEAYKYVPEEYIQKWRDTKYDELVSKIEPYEEDNDDYGWYTR